jgi:zinc D-Ala-D-Ala carboxypeptidase
VTHRRPARTRTRRIRIRWIRVAGLLGVIEAVAAVLGEQLPASSASPADVPRGEHRGALGQADKFVVESGWRSPQYQEQLLRDAVSEYGSEEEAARWVASANTSAHVSGDAVDIGPSAATAWLSEHGAWYGLCQIYENEPWHYELRPEAIDQGCPPMYADPTNDSRMQA